MDAIVAENLAKRYRTGKRKKRPNASLGLHVLRRARPTGKEIWALRDVSFSLPAGQALGVVGPNGAGKSTLLKLLARVTPPTSGRATVRGRVVSLLELGAGFQPELSGRENVYLNAAFHGIDRREVARRMDAIVGFAELDEAIDRPVGHYSSGMYLRLAFSVAINLEPDILLADEVLAVGDLEFQERCLRRVQEAGRDEGLTVLFVSHDMAAIRRLCARSLWIDQGRIAQDGPTAEVVSAYEQSAWARFSHSAAGDRGRHASEFGEILGGRLLSGDGVAIGAVRVSDDLAIETTFRTDVPDLDVRAGVVVQSEGLVAFRSVMPRLERVAEPGTYTARVRVPGHLLNDTTYQVKLGMHVHRGGERVASMAHDDALSFKVWDAAEGASARGDYADSLAGLVRPRLAWEIGRVGAPAPPLSAETAGPAVRPAG